MSKVVSVKKNFIYNMIYQVLILIVPLITAPYLSRVIGVKGVGIYSYTYSIVYYFMIFCLLGVNNYGNRTIAKCREEKTLLSKTFWEIYLFQLLTGALMIGLYILYINIFNSTYIKIAFIQILFIVSAMLDINWFYFGLEEFKVTITRNTIVKIVTVILIFIFVKSSEDLFKYTLIMAGMTALSQVFLWLCLPKRVKFVKVKIKDVLRHVKPNVILFIPVIAVSMYKIMDKIMLGAISNVTEVGLYENAEKIINIPLTVISALGTVMLPRMSNIAVKDNLKVFYDYIEKSIKFIMFMSYAMCFGIIAIGYDFAPIYFGVDFQKTGILIILLATTIPIMSFANVIRTQYLIPKEKDKIYIVSVFLGALFNLIMNLIFIPQYGSIGASIGTIIAEIVVMTYQTISVRKELNVVKYIKCTSSFLFKSLIMFLLIICIRNIKINISKRLFIQVIIGTLVYLILNIKYICSIINSKMIMEKVRNKIRKIKKK